MSRQTIYWRGKPIYGVVVKQDEFRERPEVGFRVRFARTHYFIRLGGEALTLLQEVDSVSSFAAHAVPLPSSASPPPVEQ